VPAPPAWTSCSWRPRPAPSRVPATGPTTLPTPCGQQHGPTPTPQPVVLRRGRTLCAHASSLAPTAAPHAPENADGFHPVPIGERSRGEPVRRGLSQSWATTWGRIRWGRSMHVAVPADSRWPSGWLDGSSRQMEERCEFDEFHSTGPSCYQSVCLEHARRGPAEPFGDARLAPRGLPRRTQLACPTSRSVSRGWLDWVDKQRPATTQSTRPWSWLFTSPVRNSSTLVGGNRAEETLALSNPLMDQQLFSFGLCQRSRPASGAHAARGVVGCRLTSGRRWNASLDNLGLSGVNHPCRTAQLLALVLVPSPTAPYNHPTRFAVRMPRSSRTAWKEVANVVGNLSAMRFAMHFTGNRKSLQGNDLRCTMAS